MKIENSEQHKAAMDRIEALWIENRTDDQDREFESLISAVHEYETVWWAHKEWEQTMKKRRQSLDRLAERETARSWPEKISWFKTCLHDAPVDRPLLGVYDNLDDGRAVLTVILSDTGAWYQYPPGQSEPEMSPPLLWAHWPEGPTALE